MKRDHRSMALTSVRSGILIFNCDDRLLRRLLLPSGPGGRAARPPRLYWTPEELSSGTGVEFAVASYKLLLVLLRVLLVVTVWTPTSLRISSVVSKMLP